MSAGNFSTAACTGQKYLLFTGGTEEFIIPEHSAFCFYSRLFLIHVIVGKEKECCIVCWQHGWQVMVGGGNLVTALIGKCGYRICDLDFVVEKTKGFVKVSGGSPEERCWLHFASM